MQQAMNLLAPYNASTVKYGDHEGASSDTSQWVEAGVPGIELYRNESFDGYFYFHHSNGINVSLVILIASGVIVIAK